MKIVEKENLIRENGSYFALVHLKSENEIKESSVLFEISEEFFRFSIFKNENFAQSDIDSWWSDSEIEKLLGQWKNRIFEYPKWNCDVKQGGVNMTENQK